MIMLMICYKKLSELYFGQMIISWYLSYAISIPCKSKRNCTSKRTADKEAGSLPLKIIVLLELLSICEKNTSRVCKHLTWIFRCVRDFDVSWKQNEYLLSSHSFMERRNGFISYKNHSGFPPKSIIHLHYTERY